MGRGDELFSAYFNPPMLIVATSRSGEGIWSLTSVLRAAAGVRGGVGARGDVGSTIRALGRVGQERGTRCWQKNRGEKVHVGREMGRDGSFLCVWWL